MIYFLYFSLIYIFAWNIYMGVLYLLGWVCSFLVMMNGGGLPQLQEPGFYHGDLPLAPSPDRAVSCLPDPPII
jgi:hypothetical protein